MTCLWLSPSSYNWIHFISFLILFNVQVCFCNTPHPILTLLTTLINWEREREKGKREEKRERRNRTGSNEHDRIGSSIFGHRSGQGWYRFEAWETSNVSMPSLPLEIDRKATDRSFEVPRNRRLDSPWFHRFPVKPTLGFCSLPFLLPFPTKHWRRGRHFAVDRSLKDSWLWELDPEPSPRVGGHHRHHWTQHGLNFQFWASRRRRLNSGDCWPARVFW